jgi:hypothetical protein
MEHALELSVPIEVTLKAGGNLYEIESFDLDEVTVEAEAPRNSNPL